MAKKRKKSNDFPDRVVFIMLSIVILVSLMSLGIYLEALNNSKSENKLNLDKNKMTGLGVLNDPPEVSVQGKNVEKREPVYQTGKVTLTIIEP